MGNSHRYQVRARSTRLRSGVVASDTVPDPIIFSAPPEFLGEPRVWTPEHFFLAAIASCYVSTFSAIADASKFGIVSLEVEAEGTLEKVVDTWRFMEIRLCPVLKIAREQDYERAGRLLEKAERSCLIARSVSPKIALKPAVKVVTEHELSVSTAQTNIAAGIGKESERGVAAQ